MKFTKIVYLDLSSISLAYEEIKGITPHTKIARSEDITGAVGIGIFRLSGASKEIKEYSTSTAQMFFSIEDKLRKLPKVEKKEAKQTTGLFWVEGILSVGSQSLKRNQKLIKEVDYFLITDDSDPPNNPLGLISNDCYFTSGYDMMTSHKDTLGSGLWEPVEALLKPIYYNPYTEEELYTPIVILKNERLKSGGDGH